MIEGLSGKNIGIEGALYTDLISLLVKTGRKEEAKAWYSRMTSSNAPRLELYIQNLTSRGIKF
jgi:pentatricopeptide repeat protein